MLILVIVGFGLLTDYTISNTNKQTAEGSPFDIDIPELPDPEPSTDDEGGSDGDDEGGSDGDDEGGSDGDDEGGSNGDDESGKEECEDEPGYKYKDGKCVKEDDGDNNDSGLCRDEDNPILVKKCEDNDKDDDNDNDKDDDNDNDRDKGSESNNQPQIIQPQTQITIPKPNTPPIAMNNSFVTVQNQPINIQLEVYDKENDVVDIVIIENTKFGNLIIKDINTKTMTYTPQPNFVGYDNFTFQGKDLNAYSNNATVSIIIANLPLTPDVPSPSQSSVNSRNVSSNSQNLNNLNQIQLVDLIASEISNANNIDKNKVIQAINDFIESTKAKTSNVMEPLKKLAKIILNDPSGAIANNIINTAKTK
jgi:Bacterial Ig domain